MIHYDFKGRLTYIPGGALSVQMSAWPAVGGNWWEPTTGSYTVVAAYQAKGAADLCTGATRDTAIPDGKGRDQHDANRQQAGWHYTRFYAGA